VKKAVEVIVKIAELTALPTFGLESIKSKKQSSWWFE
jgi:hypothetical protein